MPPRGPEAKVEKAEVQQRRARWADAAVCAGVLCSIEDPAAALRELARVIRPEGELRFYEHVPSSRPRAAALQRGLDATGIWRKAMGGCHTARRTDSAIVAAGFRVERLERFSFRPTLVDTPVAHPRSSVAPSAISGRLSGGRWCGGQREPAALGVPAYRPAIARMDD